MQDTRPPPADSELILLKALWGRTRLAAREIHDATAPQTGWQYSTTRKTLDRMVEKGLIRVEPMHGIKTFLPTETKSQTMARMIRRFAAQVLEMKVPMPAATFASSSLLDEADLAELDALLDEPDPEQDADKDETA